MNDFRLKWRFTEEKYDRLPEEHINQLQPLDYEAAKFLWEYIGQANLHDDTPFTKDFFQTIYRARILDGNEREIQKWLSQRGLSYDQFVFLSWNKADAMIVPWKLLIKYFDSFYYGASDDLTVIDQSLNWSLLFYHENEICFGTSKDFKPSEKFASIDSIYPR